MVSSNEQERTRIKCFRICIGFSSYVLYWGIIGVFSLPEFSGRFFISGLVFGVFATGAGTIVLKLVLNH